MGVEVVGDLAHVGVDDEAFGAPATGSDSLETGEHVGAVGFGRFGAVGPPHDHRDAADLAVGHPADVVIVVPRGDLGGLTQLADARLDAFPRLIHHQLSLTEQPNLRQ